MGSSYFPVKRKNMIEKIQLASSWDQVGWLPVRKYPVNVETRHSGSRVPSYSSIWLLGKGDKFDYTCNSAANSSFPHCGFTPGPTANPRIRIVQVRFTTQVLKKTPSMCALKVPSPSFNIWSRSIMGSKRSNNFDSGMWFGQHVLRCQRFHQTFPISTYIRNGSLDHSAIIQLNTIIELFEALHNLSKSKTGIYN